jgi:hypothetical protein
MFIQSLHISQKFTLNAQRCQRQYIVDRYNIEQDYGRQILDTHEDRSLMDPLTNTKCMSQIKASEAEK